jgi:hypothetical protein
VNRPRETTVRHVDIIPDWVIAVLTGLVVAGAFRLFGGVGVLVLGVVAGTVWIAQIIEGRKFRRDLDSGTGIAGIKEAIKSSGS